MGASFKAKLYSRHYVFVGCSDEYPFRLSTVSGRAIDGFNSVFCANYRQPRRVAIFFFDMGGMGEKAPAWRLVLVSCRKYAAVRG
jgi:hypothetical protein